MSRTSAVARGRAAAEAGMVDTCTIRRRTGETTDAFSGEVTPTWMPVYDGRCRFQQQQAQAQQTDAGQAYLLLQRIEVQLPMSVVGLQVGDEITCTAAVRDPDLVGRVFLVRDLAFKTDATSRRIRAEERTS